MGNNILTLTFIVVLFIGFFGTKYFIGVEAIDKNENLDSDSIAEIAGLDQDLFYNFEVDPKTGNISALKYEAGGLKFDEADPFERASLQERADVEDFGVSYKSSLNIVPAFFSSTPFIKYDDFSFYIALFSVFLVFVFGVIFYKALRGQVDNG
jgi:hypothetical protein